MTMNLDDLLARAEITDILTSYVHVADRNDWELVRRCYHADASDDHGLYSGDIDGLILFLRGVAEVLTATFHQLGPPHIRLDGDSAHVETYCLGWYQRSTRDDSNRSIAQGLRYLDNFERRNDRWAISKRVVVLDWEHVLPLHPSSPASSWQRGARGADDPSFEFLMTSPGPAVVGWHGPTESDDNAIENDG